MADRLGVSRTSYANWEKETEPDLATINNIARHMGVSPLQLLVGVLDFSKEDIAAFNKNSVIKQMDYIGTSLGTLTSAICKLSGLSEQEAFSLLNGNLLGKSVAFQQLDDQEKTDKKKKSGK